MFYAASFTLRSLLLLYMFYMAIHIYYSALLPICLIPHSSLKTVHWMWRPLSSFLFMFSSSRFRCFGLFPLLSDTGFLWMWCPQFQLMDWVEPSNWKPLGLDDWGDMILLVWTKHHFTCSWMPVRRCTHSSKHWTGFCTLMGNQTLQVMRFLVWQNEGTNWIMAGTLRLGKRAKEVLYGVLYQTLPLQWIARYRSIVFYVG